MIDLLTGLALVFVVEGLVLALFPHRLRWLLERMAEVPPEVLGPIDDFWFHWVGDIGITGPAKARAASI